MFIVLEINNFFVPTRQGSKLIIWTSQFQTILGQSLLLFKDYFVSYLSLLIVSGHVKKFKTVLLFYEQPKTNTDVEHLSHIGRKIGPLTLIPISS